MSVELILASQSPRRVQLLTQLGLQFKCMPSNVDETTSLREPDAVVNYLSRIKAEEIARKVQSRQRSQSESNEGTSSGVVRTLVLGADTIVVLDDNILGKPIDRDDALEMLSALSGREHEVYTGVTIVECKHGGLSLDTRCSVSKVVFRDLSLEEINAYIDTGEPMDKAGAYAVQGAASAFIEEIRGCYTTIVGLPVPLTVAMLREAGVPVLGLPK